MRAAGRPRVPLVLGTTITVAGAMVVVGWVTPSDALRGPVPGAAEMKLNTAVAIALLGAAACALALDRQWLGRAAGVVAGTIGVLTLAQYVTGADLGIDELLRDDDGRSVGRYPGRMAPISATIVVLLATCVMLGPRRHRAVYQGLAVAGWLLTTFALFGYVFGAITPRAGTTTPIAPHTAILLNLTAATLLALQRDYGLAALLRGSGAGSLVARRVVLPALVVLPVIGWLRLEGEYAGLYGVRDGIAIYTLAFFCVLAATSLIAARALNDWQLRAERGEHRLQGVLDAATEQAIIATDAEGTITVFSAGAERMLGWRADELLGRETPALIHDPTEVAERAAELGIEPGFGVFVHEVLRTSAPETRLWTYVRRDGTRLPVQLTVTAMRDPDGVLQGFLGVAIDRTEGLAAEAALHAAVAEAERANQAKSEFLSRMSHELRTPLNAILGFGQVLEMEELTESQREAVGYILGGGRHLLGLIEELLDISRIETGVIQVDLEPVEVGPVVRECLQLLAPLAATRTISLRSDVPAGAFVLADRQRLLQVLLNLVSNAVKYNRDGGDVNVTLRDGDPVELMVDDTGPGLPHGSEARLFAPFDRLGAEASVVEGTGLGLAVSRGLVELMDGALRVERAPGGGTRFVVALTGASGPVGAPAPAGEVTLDPRVRTVLCVEDNPVNLHLVELVLAAHPGVEVIAAPTGKAGLEQARRRRPDVVLLDLHLPDLSGLEVLRALRDEPDLADVPVVVLTADAADDAREALRAAGAGAFATKPFAVPELLGAINGAVSQVPPPPAARSAVSGQPPAR